MKNGYWQRMLRIDLAKRKTRVEEIQEKDLREFIGGAGLGAEILRRELLKKIASFDSRNLLIFGTGPFQGPAVPGKVKFSITGISLQTHTYADMAAGADWGPSFKDAGYDVLVIEGVSERPVYLQIVDDRVEIKGATYLWGLDTLILKVARTIADLEGQENIQAAHLSEVIQYCTLDRNLIA